MYIYIHILYSMKLIDIHIDVLSQWSHIIMINLQKRHPHAIGVGLVSYSSMLDSQLIPLDFVASWQVLSWPRVFPQAWNHCWNLSIHRTAAELWIDSSMDVSSCYPGRILHLKCGQWRWGPLQKLLAREITHVQIQPWKRWKRMKKHLQQWKMLLLLHGSRWIFLHQQRKDSKMWSVAASKRFLLTYQYCLPHNALHSTRSNIWSRSPILALLNGHSKPFGRLELPGFLHAFWATLLGSQSGFDIHPNTSCFTSHDILTDTSMRSQPKFHSSHWQRAVCTGQWL